MSELTFTKALKPLSSNKISEEIRNLKNDFPFIKTKIIGKSVYGYSIYAIEIGKSSWPKTLLSGGFKGNDHISTQMLFGYVRKISSALATGRCIDGRNTGDIFSGKGIAVVPLVNPDGVEIASNGAEHDHTGRIHRLCGSDYAKWEANAKGVDINLNFGARRHGAPKDNGEKRIFGPSFRGWAGMYPHSEPEVKALNDYCHTKKFISASVFFEGDNHVIYRTGENYRESGVFAARFAKSAGYTLESNDRPLSAAGFKNWFSSFTGRPAIEVYTNFESVNSLYAAITQML